MLNAVVARPDRLPDQPGRVRRAAGQQHLDGPDRPERASSPASTGGAARSSAWCSWPRRSGSATGSCSNRTRFGFELTASGESPTAATAGGVNAKRMVIIALLMSGAVAGLVGLPEVLGRDTPTR